MTTTKVINTLWEKDTAILKDVLLNILVKQSYKEGDFTLTSGKKSTYYIDGKQTTLDPYGGVIISVLFLRMLKENIKSVGGLSIGADPLASGVSQLGYLLGRNINAFYVRKDPKKHGTHKWIEGPLHIGDHVAILEDVVTTGGSSIKAINKATDFGCKVEQILTVVDRNEGGREAFKQREIEYHYLFDIDEVVERYKNLG